jgi:hypothetical protein
VPKHRSKTKKHHWTYRGPICDDDVPRYKYYRAERDYLFAQAELEGRAHKKSARALSDIYMNFWVSCDVMLPLRWQIAGDCMDLLLQFHNMPLRELRASVDKLDKRRNYKNYSLIYLRRTRMLTVKSMRYLSLFLNVMVIVR